MSTLLSTSEGEAGGHRAMLGSNVLVNILKPVNIVNLGNTLRCGVVWGEEALVTEPMNSFQVRGRQDAIPPPTYI